MHEKQPKRPKDANQLAKFVVDAATEGMPQASPKQVRASKGGAVGGSARAKALTQEQRTEIARTAASARWKKSD